MARPATLDHLRSRKKPTTSTVDIVLDPDLADRHNDLSQKVSMLEARLRVSEKDSPELEVELASAQEDLASVRSEMDESGAVATFTFRSLPPREYDDLINAHPPSAEQRAKAKAMGEVMSFDPDAFMPAIIAACLEDPKLSVDEVGELFKDASWNAAELQSLFVAAMECNQTRRNVSLPKG